MHDWDMVLARRRAPSPHGGGDAARLPDRIGGLLRKVAVFARVHVHTFVLRTDRVEQLQRSVSIEDLVVPLDHEQYRTLQSRRVGAEPLDEESSTSRSANEPARPQHRCADSGLRRYQRAAPVPCPSIAPSSQRARDQTGRTRATRPALLIRSQSARGFDDTANRDRGASRFATVSSPRHCPGSRPRPIARCQGMGPARSRDPICVDQRKLRCRDAGRTGALWPGCPRSASRSYRHDRSRTGAARLRSPAPDGIFRPARCIERPLRNTD